MASICLKKFRHGVDAQWKIKEKRMQEEEEEEAAKRATEKEREREAAGV